MKDDSDINDNEKTEGGYGKKKRIAIRESHKKKKKKEKQIWLS